MLARVWPSGKLIVDDRGAVVALTVTATYPDAVWPVTVRLPVTATASGEIPPTPATGQERAVLAVNPPAQPDVVRVSRTRTEAIGT